MNLTGKAKNDFIDWLYENQRLRYFKQYENKPEFIKNAYIKKFFETKLIQFGIEPIQGGAIRCFLLIDKFTHDWVNDRFETEQEALQVLIPKANLIYNLKSKEIEKMNFK